MKFLKSYDYLEMNRYFDTIWVALPKTSFTYLRTTLQPIRKYCHWCAVVDGDRIPHITLRYMGYDSKRLRRQALRDKKVFTRVIVDLSPILIEVGEIVLWESPSDRPEKQFRLNWKISGGKKLDELHKSLLGIEGYSFFRSLEGKNYNPHISLGKLNLDFPNAAVNVRNYLKKLPRQTTRLKLVDFELNLASKDKTECYQVRL